MRGSRLSAVVGTVMMALAPRCLAATTAPDSQITFDQVISKWIVQENGTWAVDARPLYHSRAPKGQHFPRRPRTGDVVRLDQKLEIMQRRVDKPDGHSVVLGKETIRKTHPRVTSSFHEFSDQHRFVVTFSNAETGDMLVLRTHHESVPSSRARRVHGGADAGSHGRLGRNKLYVQHTGGYACQCPRHMASTIRRN